MIFVHLAIENMSTFFKSRIKLFPLLQIFEVYLQPWELGLSVVAINKVPVCPKYRHIPVVGIVCGEAASPEVTRLAPDDGSRTAFRILAAAAGGGIDVSPLVHGYNQE